MTDPWSPLFVAMRGVHPDFNARDLASYKAILGGELGFDPLLATQAVNRLAVSGRKFFPRMTAADIGAECQVIVRPDLAPVAWTELAASLDAAMREASQFTEMPRRERAAVVGHIVRDELGAIAGAWAATVALSADSISRDSLRREWESYEPTIRERAVLGGIEPLTPEQAALHRGRVPRVLPRPDLAGALPEGSR